MTDEEQAGTQADQPNGATEAPAATGTQPPAGTSPTQAADETGEPETISLDEARKLRRENASLRDRLKPLETAAKERQKADEASLPELERTKKQVARLEAQIAEMQVREQEGKVRMAAVESATRLGMRSPELAYRLLDRAAIEFDESGSPKNVDAQLKTLLQKEPYLAKGGQADFGGGSRGTTPESQPSMNDALRALSRGR